MSFMQAVEQVFKKYAVFEGRARRSEFWYFQLFQFLVYFVLGILSVTGIFAVFIPIYFLGSLIPNLAVTWRRYHDIGKSGMYYFLIWIPLVGLILTIVWLSQDSQPGINQYGASPKAYSGAGAYAGPQAGAAQGHLAVQCIAGPLQGQTYSVRGSEMVFGRDSTCMIRMPDGTAGVSRRHCCIRWQQGMPMLVDLGSSYGTFLADGKQLPPNYPEPVAAGTRFYLGNRGNMFQIIVF